MRSQLCHLNPRKIYMNLKSCLSPGAGQLWCPQTLWQVPGDSVGQHRPGPEPHTVEDRAVYWQALSLGANI